MMGRFLYLALPAVFFVVKFKKVLRTASLWLYRHELALLDI